MKVDLPKIQPKILALITTYKCTSACPNCCFNCSPRPRNDKSMSLENIKNYIDATIRDFPSVNLVTFTGGECSLLGKELFKAIAYASSKNLRTRIVTNAKWAKEYPMAVDYVKKLSESGLDEINFSTGNEHQKFVDIDTICNAVKASTENNSIKDVVICIETEADSFVDTTKILENASLLSIPEQQKKKIHILQSPWISFRKKIPNLQVTSKTNKYGFSSSSCCTNLFDSVTISPNGNIFACCGLAVGYSRYLQISHFSDDNFKASVEDKYNDILKLWLFTEGPYEILQHLNFPTLPNRHMCEYCFQIFNNEQILQKIANLDQKKIKSIIVNYCLRASKYEI